MSEPITSAEEFRARCEFLMAQAPMYRYTDLDTYFVDDNFDDYTAAAAWWPQDAPPSLQLPTLHTFALMRQVAPGTSDTTFTSILARYTQRVTAWLLSEGRDVQYPNETPTQRKARKNREAQARHRERTSTSHGSSISPEQQQRIDIEVEALAALTQERDATLAELDAKVLAAQATFLQLCAERTAERNRFQGMVVAQRELVSKTKRGHQ